VDHQDHQGAAQDEDQGAQLQGAQYQGGQVQGDQDQDAQDQDATGLKSRRQMMEMVLALHNSE